MVATTVNVTLVSDAFVLGTEVGAAFQVRQTHSITLYYHDRYCMLELYHHNSTSASAFQEGGQEGGAFSGGWFVCGLCSLLLATLALVVKSFERLIDEVGVRV